MKTYIAAYVLLITLPLSAGLLPKLEVKAGNATTPASNPTSCEDFSGNWRGDCIDSDGKKELGHEGKIEQFGCTMLRITEDGFPFIVRMDDLAVNKYNSPGAINGSISVFHWNYTYKTLKIFTHVVTKPLAKDDDYYGLFELRLNKSNPNTLSWDLHYPHNSNIIKCVLTK
jgi:hypothetical protein